MILRKSGDTTVINQGSEGGGGGSQPSVALGPLLTSLNAEAMPSAEGYLHWSGTAWEWTTPTGGDPVDLTPYALKTWVETNYASKDDISEFITESQAEDLFAAIDHTHDNYLPLSAGANKALTGSLYISGNSGINWAGGVGMLCYMPSSGWTGISASQWGVGATSAQGVIRSNANDILHYRNGTNYKIWDAYNFTPSDYLPLTGGTVESLTVTNDLDADSITVGSIVNSSTLAEYLDADAMQTWLQQQGYITQTTADGRYIKGVSVYGSSLNPDTNRVVNIPYADINTPGVIQIGTGLVNDNEGHTTVDTTVIASRQWANSQFVTVGNAQTITGEKTFSGNTTMVGNWLYFKRTTNGSAVGTMFATNVRPQGSQSYVDCLRIAGTVDFDNDGTPPMVNGNYLATQEWVDGRYLPLTAGSSKPLTGSLFWNVANQTDNLIISNNKIQLSVSGTPHNIVLFEGSTANLTSYAKFYERPMVKTGTNNGTPVYTNVALVSEVEAKQNIIHFFNTKNSNTEVSFSNIYLPLNYQGGGTVYLDLSDYATASALNDYLPLMAGSDKPLTGQLYLDTGGTTEVYVNVKSNRATASGGGWAFPLITARNAAGTSVFSMGVYGVAAASTYSYIGMGGWNSANNLRVYSNGSISLGNSIKYQGTNSLNDMITFVDNKNDQWGNGIAIGGGGATIIGGGESAATMIGQLPKVTVDGVENINGGSEVMYIGNDTSVSIFTNLGTASGWANRKEFTFYNTGVLSTAGSVVTPNGSGLYIKDTGGTERMAVFVNNSNQFFVGFGMRNAGYEGYFDSNIMYLRSGASGTTMTLDASNNVGIGTTSPQAKLDVNGSVKIAGSLTGVTTISTSSRIFAGGDIETKGSFVWCDSQNFGLTIMEGLAVSGDANYCRALFRHKPQVQLGSDMLEVVVAKSDENGIEFRGSEDGTYTFGYGSGRGDIYAGAGDFTGAIEATSYNFRGTADAYGHGGASISHKSSSSVEGLEYYAGSRSGQHYFKAYNSNGNEVYANIHCLTCDETSDIRQMEVVEYLNPSVYDIANAPIIKFRWIDGGNDLHLGSISQYWEKTLPETVHIGDDLMQSMEKSTIALLAGITAARKAVDNERRIAELELRVAELEDALAALVPQQSETTEN